MGEHLARLRSVGLLRVPVAGGQPYGTKEGEQAVIERMNQLRAAGVSFDNIAITLNNEGVPTRTTGKKWHGFAENQILKAQAESHRD